MRFILRSLGRYKLAAAIALLLMLIELTTELVQPLLISKIIDQGIKTQDMSIVLQWSAVLLACSLLAFGAGIISSFYAAHVSQSFGYDVRERLYEKVQSFSYANFNRFPTASLITRLTNDATQLQSIVFMGLRIMLRAPLLVMGGVIMAFVVHAKLALLLAVAVPLLLGFMIWVMRKGEKLFRLVQQQLDRVNSVMQENLLGMRLIRIFVRMQHESARFARASSRLMDRTVAALRLTEITMPFILFIMNTGIIAVLWFGRLEIDAGGASVGEVVAIVNYAMRTAGALSVFSMIVVNFSRARASAERITEVLEENSGFESADGTGAGIGAGAGASAIGAGTGKGAGAGASTGASAGTGLQVRRGEVAFQGVSFTYPGGDRDVLRDITFAARQGDTIAIMGATGSGKSSLMQLIPRLYEADGGRIRIDGEDIARYKLKDLRSRIGYVPQEVLLFSGTVRDNIAWGKEDAALEEVVEAARAAQLHETIMKLPRQYDTLLGQRGVNLSGGQKQRLSIARALVRKPAILLLDDSTSALDAQTEQRLLQAIGQQSCTIFLITQKVSATANADLVLLLDEGELIAQGTHEDLLEASPLYRRICQSQLAEGGERYA